MKIEVRKVSDDFLKCWEWVFWWNDNLLVLDKYYFLEKQTKRHKFRPVAYYTRISFRGSSTIKLNDVPVPQWVISECRRQASEQFIVCTDMNRTPLKQQNTKKVRWL